MATRSWICKTYGEPVKYIYCHWDGYPNGVGKTLREHYDDKDLVDKLLALGDISSLREKLEPDKDKPHTWENPQEDVTVAYHRDRGERMREASTASDLVELLEKAVDSDAEYVYIYTPISHWSNPGEWEYMKNETYYWKYWDVIQADAILKLLKQEMDWENAPDSWKRKFAASLLQYVL